MLWNKHISNIRSTAFMRLCFLRGKLKHSTRDVKLTAYKAYIRPFLEYGSVVWSPFAKKGVDALEKIQTSGTFYMFQLQTNSVSNRHETHAV